MGSEGSLTWSSDRNGAQHLFAEVSVILVGFDL
jgi:hypothetical protein